MPKKLEKPELPKHVVVHHSPDCRADWKEKTAGKRVRTNSLRLCQIHPTNNNCDWYVRMPFPTGKRDDSGNLIYFQPKRRCEPKTADRAAEVADELQIEIETIKEAAEAPPTLGQYLEQFNSAKKASVARRTHEIFEETYSRYLRDDSITDVKLAEIRPLPIQQFYERLASKGTSPAMIKKVHEYLAGAFNQAIRWEVLTKSPMTGVIAPKVEKSEAVWFDPPEAWAFLEVCRTDLKYFVLEFALETGMRPGEYLALRWSDIHNNEVRVRRSLAVNYKDGGWEIKELKTRSSRRTIAMSPELSARLALHRQAQLAEVARLESVIEAPVPRQYKTAVALRRKKRSRHKKLSAETVAAYRHYDLVFPAANGVPMTRMNLTKWRFKPACKAAGLNEKKFSLYTLRHTMATLSLSAKSNIKAVAEKMGHADVNLLLETYAHVIPSMRKEVTDNLRSVLYSKKAA